MRRLWLDVCLIAFFCPMMLTPAQAAPKKGEAFYKEAKTAEAKRDWDSALELYEKASLQDPGNIAYQAGARRVRFQAGQTHVDNGRKLRTDNKLDDALAEFRLAFSIDPSSAIAEQEIRRTAEMIESRKAKGSPPEQSGLTPAEAAKKADERRVATLQGPPQLRALGAQRITLLMNNQPPRILFETIAKLAGINTVFDPEYPLHSRTFSVEFNKTTLEQALDSVALQTKSYWKAIGENTIFITLDNVTKRRDYEDVMVKTFYLQNVTSVQELQEIATAVRAVTEVRRLFTYNGQNAIILRGSMDQVVLAEKLIQDMDKPKSEVVVDVVVMELSKTKTRDLASGLTSGGASGLSLAVSFSPRNPITTTSSDSSTSSTTSTAISLSQLGRISPADFAVTLPGALFKAVLSNREGRVLQSPQVRTIEMQKASLRIGDKIPYATGSFSSGVASTAVSSLVSTQFQFAEVGVNLDLVPKVHDRGEISMHVELELSTVRERIDIGGLSQPVIGQRKLMHDIRLKQGEVSLLGGLQGLSESKTTGGIPGVSQVPILKRLFGSESTEKVETELVIFLVPHIVRGPELTPANLRGIATGNDATVKLIYGSEEVEP